MTRATGPRLTRALLGYYLAVIAVITLLPFRFVVPGQLGFVRIIDASDFAANILLFLPFGFLYALSLDDEAPAAALRALALGTLASIAVEVVQMFEPERYPSPADIVANGLGAGIGGVLCGAAKRRVRASALVGRLALELPLMGLIYLLVPLLWVASLAIGDNALRLWMLALPVVFGATILGMMQRHHFGPARAVSNAGMAATAAGAVLLGAFPALVRAPAVVLALAALAAAVVLRHAAPDGDRLERRFEVPALRTALPFYVLYLAACAFAPLTEPGSVLGFRAPGEILASIHTIEILRLLHASAAFTLLGYTIAELRGRLELPFPTTLRRVLLFASPAALGTRIIGDVVLGPAAGRWAPGFATLWLILGLGGAAYGAWLYHLQRSHVRALIGARTPLDSSVARRAA
jgi:VanZ family protein